MPSFILVSVRGERRMPYGDFHTGYKKTRLAPDELIRAICLPRRFADYFSYTRKVGARNAQAISKVCIAALGRIVDGVVEDVRIAVGQRRAGSASFIGNRASFEGQAHGAVAAGVWRKQTAIAEIAPIDDIRSTAKYRAVVAGNLVEEFVTRLGAVESTGMTERLARWNVLPMAQAAKDILPCCGSTAWADRMAARKPFADEASLLAASDETWRNLTKADWMEAFRSHPRIGGSGLARNRRRRSRNLRSGQSRSRKVGAADDAVKAELAEGKSDYERRFSRIFIVCATGKSGPEILEILRRRLRNDEEHGTSRSGGATTDDHSYSAEEMAFGMNRISTHVLDTARGKPAKDVPVRLERQDVSGNWRNWRSARTDQDGRCAQMLPDDTALQAGLYRLTFDTANYFATAKINGLYPVVEITFQVRDGESHFHVPLLLSPNGYTTYRGS